jgi:copper resistance protein B
MTCAIDRRYRVCVFIALVLMWQGAAAAAQQVPQPPAPAPSAPHEHPAPAPSSPAPGQGQDEHAGHQMPQPSTVAQTPPPDALPPGIPPITDADRVAAFPDVQGHTVHDQSVHAFVLIDQLEWRAADGGPTWDSRGWIGRDLDRFWFRMEGAADGGGVREAEAHLLYGRAIGRWWDFVAGIRQDVRPDPARTWAVIGIQGLAPYWFEVEATAAVGRAGSTHLRLETEYELLLTNRLIAQPRAEVNLHGKSDPERGIGAGLSSADLGVRVRYELRREVAPYVGVEWHRSFFSTADLAEAAGRTRADARLVLGLRLWY